MALLTGLLIAAGISAFASIAGSAIAQGMQNKSVSETNETNKQINSSNNVFNAEQASIDRDFQASQAAETRAFNSAEAEKQRQWQEHMSNTEVQRRAADLQVAGFNPMLAVTSGSASTPGAASATSGMIGGSRAQASGFIPMRAQDYSPTAAMASNLSHLVSSANSIIMLQKLANKNPEALAGLSRMSNVVSKSVTSASKSYSMSSIMKDIQWLEKTKAGL